MSASDLIWQWIGRIGSVIAIIGIPYLINDRRKYLSRFSFDFEGSSRSIHDKNNQEYCRFEYSGKIKNHSLRKNSLQRIYIVVWANKRKTATLSFGYGGVEVFEDGNKISLPISFSSKESKNLKIFFDFIIEGTHNEKLIKSFKPIQPASRFFLPKYEYELAFEDIDHNLFDQEGNIKNRKTIDLKWGLQDFSKDLIEFKFAGLGKRLLLIFWSDLKFAIFKIFRCIGLA